MRRATGVALRVVPALVGWLVIVAMVDLAVGAVAGRGDAPAPPPDLLLDGPITEQAGDTEIDPRVNAPAMGGVAWSEDYWAQLQSLEYRYVPFYSAWAKDTALRYFHIQDGVRRSYRQAGVGDDAPVVWFFGGSTMWGEGQRDLHTIPSQVARQAEEQGVALRVVNYGERGRAHWEEMIRFERALAEEGPPDAVVFYDGINDVNVQKPEQGGIPSDDPTVYDVGAYIPAEVPPPLSAEDQVAADSWMDRILERSLILRLAGHLGLESPAAADDTPTNEQIAQRALDVYRRGRAVSQGLADRAGIPALFFWQPDGSTKTAGTTASLAHDGIDPPTIDVSGALDDVPDESVYLDGGHTNELGADLIAQAILPHLLDTLGQRPAGS